MIAPSFERFDYQLRSNKNIERKLVFDLLAGGRLKFGFQHYRYIGLGSMWFADHRLAHRILGIDDLVSIERAIHADRADFNKPYRSLDVLPGEVSEILSNLYPDYWQKPTIVWLDYDGALNNEIAIDLERLLSVLAIDSVLIVTVNASYRTYKRNSGGNNRAVTAIESTLGDVVPARLKPATRPSGPPLDVLETDFPIMLAESLLSYLAHKTRATGRRDANGKTVQFVPLYNVSHKDGADMVTIGGAISSGANETAWRQLLLEDRVLENSAGFPKHCSLDLVPLTLKEKLALDALLPSDGSVPIDVAAQGSGIRLEAEQVQKYERYYRHFPIFIETPL